MSENPPQATGIETEGVTVVIPAYNEEKGVGPVLARLAEVMDSTEVPYEILVVDDGSTDGTSQAVKDAGYEAIRHPRNRGYGGALKTGFKNAKYGFVAIIDADGTYPVHELANLVNLAKEEDHDMIVAARVGADVHIPTIRKPAKWFLRQLASYLTNRHIPDLNSGLRLMKKASLLRYVRLLPDGFSLTSTITVAMLSSGEDSVRYVPIDYHARVGSSKIRPIRDTLGFLQLILRTGLYFAPLRFFLPMALGLLVVAAAVFLYSYLVLGQIMDATVAIIVMTAVQVSAIGLLADLIEKRT